MQYLQGRHEDAYQTIQRAIKAATDHDAPFDAARYAARTGRTAEAVALLDQCIDLVPATIITMFAEEDFRA
jgi:tetratricopeptide (TPR) repeat protein